MRVLAPRPGLVEETDNEDVLNHNDISEFERFNGHGYKKKNAFRKSHPGQHFCHLARLKLWVVPKVFVPKGRLCKIEELKIDAGKDVDEDTDHLREQYAKIALLMFYPHRKLDDLKKRGSYWELFLYNLKLYRRNKKTTFWKKGFQILQNIQDRMTLQQNMKQVKDFITNHTTCQAPDEAASKDPNIGDDSGVEDILKCFRQRG